MKKIIIGLVILVLAIAAISIGLIHSQAQNQEPVTSVLLKDIGKLEYKFNKDEVVVYKMTQDKTVTSEHEYLKNAGGHAIESWYIIMKIEDIIDEHYKFIMSDASEELGELTRRNFDMTKKGMFANLVTDFWFQINQPIFLDENKEQWETELKIKPYGDRPEDPTIISNAKYRIKGTTKINDKDCLIIETQISFKEIVKTRLSTAEIDLNDKSISYFDYKEGKILKMDLNHYYKIIAIEEEKRTVIRDEHATIKYELSDKKFTQTQLDAWLYDKFPDIE